MSEFGRRTKYVAVPALAPGLAACGGAKTTTAEVPHSTVPAATATATPNKPKLGYDVSYPQGGTTLPKTRAFGIVGLNGTLANNANPYFTSEFSWAEGSIGGTSQPKASVYVHVADPGNTVPDWPESGLETSRALRLLRQENLRCGSMSNKVTHGNRLGLTMR